MLLRRFILATVCAILSAGCGQEQDKPEPVDLTGTSIVWQGRMYEDGVLLARFDATMECLYTLNIYRSGSPYVVLTDGSFYCGNVRASGCYSRNSETIYVLKSDTAEMSSFEHEVIHWATGLGTEGHDTVYFSLCSGQKFNYPM